MIDNRNLQELKRYLDSEYPRYELINSLIEKNSFLNYLEIGVFHGENIRKIKADHKDGVDPGNEGIIDENVNYPMTSDDFFELIRGHDIKYDIIFIDGLHHSEQVNKDIENSLNHIVDNGYVILHDCNPLFYDMQLVPRQTIVWNGDVWKSVINLKINRRDLTVRVVDTDHGVGIVQKKESEIPNLDFNKSLNDWNYFDSNRKEILDLISVDEFKKIYL